MIRKHVDLNNDNDSTNINNDTVVSNPALSTLDNISTSLINSLLIMPTLIWIFNCMNKSFNCYLTKLDNKINTTILVNKKQIRLFGIIKINLLFVCHCLQQNLNCTRYHRSLFLNATITLFTWTRNEGTLIHESYFEARV